MMMLDEESSTNLWNCFEEMREKIERKMRAKILDLKK
jgi:hypothetical protein